MEIRDPIENDPKYKEIFTRVEMEVEQELGNFRPIGYCHLFWSMKKQILKEKYGIDWKTPAELNPTTEYD
jgi:hypothetical protein